MGAGRIGLRLERTEVSLGGVTVFRHGSSAGPAARRRAEARLAGDEVAWSADITRDGRPLTSCGNLDVIAREPQALSANARS